MDLADQFTKFNATSRNDVRAIVNDYSDVFGKMKGLCIDIGAGPGDSSHDTVLPALDPSAKIVCLDISEKMTEFGRRKYEDNDRMSFVTQDIEALELPRHMLGQFDHAFSFNCLHWCRDLRQVFKNVYKLLKPEGSAVLFTISRHPVFDAYEVLAAQPQYRAYMKDAKNYISDYHHCISPVQNFTSLLEDSGFKVIDCKLHERSWLQRIDDLDKFLVSVNPFWERIPEELRESFRKDLTSQTIKYITLSNGENNENLDHTIIMKWNLLSTYFTKQLQYAPKQTFRKSGFVELELPVREHRTAH